MNGYSFAPTSLARRPSLLDQPEDVLLMCVRALSDQRKRPAWVTALCACNKQLWGLLPPDLRERYLEQALKARPSPLDLCEKGVLKGDPNASLLVIQRRHDLQKALVTSAVSNRLKARPEALALLERGVLKAEPGASLLVTTRKADLHKALVTSGLSNRLRARPEPASLLERGVLKAEPGVSPSLIQAREQLQKEMIKQTLNRSLATQLPTRPRAETY